MNTTAPSPTPGPSTVCVVASGGICSACLASNENLCTACVLGYKVTNYQCMRESASAAPIVVTTFYAFIAVIAALIVAFMR